MKTLILAAVLLSAATAAVAQVSVTVGQPGFYGRIDIGDYPAPQLIYPQPVIVQRPQYSSARPIYLRVPPGHAKHWSKHCRKYNACNQEVYFVQDSWYNNQYAPRYRQQHGDHGRPGGRPPQQQHGRPDYNDRDHHDDKPGKGHGNGRGNDKGHGNGHGNGHRGNDN
ncbi:hypothetical protein [Janthinobacterium sp.]|uniref:hypothetical protein n=1 Tax=Janthinobacterium sp. TaxID=1871054 RepID=UPI002625F146|nr:hypothetical protein [Janthinobacterium sp.]